MSSSSSDSRTAPALSVVVATTHPWPASRDVLDSLYSQAVEVGAEVLLVHRGDGFPNDAAQRYPGIVGLVAPGTTVLQMRAMGIQQSRGDVVAETEDHCVVAPDWCRAVLTAHRDYPEAAAIGGPVENGATGKALDWAAYFVGNAWLMDPVPDGPAQRIAAQANCSYKRWALPDVIPPHGFLEMDHNADLRARGKELRIDRRLRVHHVQSLTARETCGANFHTARYLTGLHAASGATYPLYRGVRAAASHGRALLRQLRYVWGKNRMRGRIVAASPWIAVISVCILAGVAVGQATGPGASGMAIE